MRFTDTRFIYNSSVFFARLRNTLDLPARRCCAVGGHAICTGVAQPGRQKDNANSLTTARLTTISSNRWSLLPYQNYSAMKLHLRLTRQPGWSVSLVVAHLRVGAIATCVVDAARCFYPMVWLFRALPFCRHLLPLHHNAEECRGGRITVIYCQSPIYEVINSPAFAARHRSLLYYTLRLRDDRRRDKTPTTILGGSGSGSSAEHEKRRRACRAR